MLTMGQELGGRYEILRPLGRGGMGGVYLANHVELHTEVAVKEMLLEGMDPVTKGAAVRQFRTEARILRQLRHPNLPVVYDFFEEDGRHYLIMEFIQGRTMQEIVEAQGPVPEAQTLAWARELCAVLGFLHAQNPPVIFRDLKPANVMVDVHGHVKLIDFGIAKIFRAETGTGTHTAARGAGTAGYAAPEQYGGATDERTDVYSLGATLYTLLSGATPPQSVEIASGMVRLQDLRATNPTVSERTLDAVAMMMRLDRKERPSSVRMVQALLLDVPDAVPSQEPASESRIPSAAALMLIPAVLAMLFWRVNTSPPTVAASPGASSPVAAASGAAASTSPPAAAAAASTSRPGAATSGGRTSSSPSPAASRGSASGSSAPRAAATPPPLPPMLPPQQVSYTSGSGGASAPPSRDLLPQQPYPTQGGAGYQPTSGSYQPPASGGGGTIQPGVGAGGVRLGMTHQQLLAQFGPGQENNTSLGTGIIYYNHGFMAFVQNGVVVAIMTKGNKLSTSSGIATGSSEAQVRAEFGTSYQVATRLPMCNAWQIYPDAGIAFGIKHGRVDGIMIASGATLRSGL